MKMLAWLEARDAALRQEVENVGGVGLQLMEFEWRLMQ
jgi:hypothetical protein